MTDTPEGEPEQRLPVPRPPAEPAPVERFSSPPATRSVELSPERAAQVVRQSSNARWVGFLTVVVVILFITVYWFYELAPLGIREPRLDAEANSQQVTSVERGYNLYEANCARCHGANGEGGIGPALNRQDKLYAHLSVDYLNNMLVAGGRYACGNVNSVMPVWSNEGHPPGPLNYIQIDDLISFIRAPSNETYTIRDPELGEPKRDPITERGPDVQRLGRRQLQAGTRRDAVPGLLVGRVRGRRPGAPSGRRPRPRVDPNAPKVDVTASGHRVHDPETSTAPADKPFVIDFDNQDAEHAAQRRRSRTRPVRSSSPARRSTASPPSAYQVPALAAGTYPFLCTVHPTMTGTLTVK